MDPLPSSFSAQYLAETVEVIRALNHETLDRMAIELAQVRARGGRLFILGVGGSAGHASHAVNDFRKICRFEAYTPTDNASELTARVNDDGWDSTFVAWLKGSRLRGEDGVLVFSVGGGDREKRISTNVVLALEHARAVGAAIFGIVGRDGGFTRQTANVCAVVPPLIGDRITPHTEGICAVLWHLLVSHPALQEQATKWESVTASGASGPGKRDAG